MHILLAVIATAVLIALSGIHIYWLFGGTAGVQAAIPTRDNSDSPVFKPRQAETAAVAVLLLVAAMFVSMQAGVLPAFAPTWFITATVWTIGGVFLLRAVGEFRYLGFFKRIRSTKFARLDTLFYSPLCLLLSVSVLSIMLLR